jgi:putative glutamine amidotransferase
MPNLMKIGITQRVEKINNTNEERECLDQRWIKLLECAEFEFLIIPNLISRVDKWLEKNNVNGIILTGGNDLSHLENANNTSYQRDKIEMAILDWAKKNKLPVLGVCRGMQMINFYLGGSLSKIQNHAGIIHNIKIFRKGLISETKINVNSYHDWGIKASDLSLELSVIAVADDNSIEAVIHNKLPWIGIMWHPEREENINDINNINFLKKVFSI